MSEYLHGAYGDTQAEGYRVAATGESAIVCVGTAPVHTVEGGAKNVNVPKLVSNIAEAKKYFGYSDDWADYTLCEVMHHFFETKAVGPLVLINVLDPAVHKSETTGTKSLVPTNNRMVITGADKIILDSVKVGTKVKGTDYTVSYNSAKKAITISGIASGSLGTEALEITYESVDPSAVDNAAVIGSSDGMGTNTGLFAIKNINQLTGVIPAYLIAPGFSAAPEIHAAMAQNSRKVNGHWDMWMFADLPIMNGETAMNMDNVVAWKNANGYSHENETVYFPMVDGADGKKYHLSVLAAANFMELLANNNGIPYHSASNTECGIIKSLYLGEANVGKLYDDEIINEKLNKNGIASAAYVGGRWVIWGAHAADYNQEDADTVNVAETNRMMLYYLSNDFQMRRPRNVDQPLTQNDIASIVAEEQARLDGLVASGALLFGKAAISTEAIENSDVMSGDYLFEFRVTTVPLAKSLKAIVTWVDDGFATYYVSDSDAA